MFKHFYANWDQYFDKLLLRPQQTANSPEIIRRLGGAHTCFSGL